MSSGPVASKEGKVLHPDLLNENLKKTQYAVRGELFLKAEELRKAGREIIITNGRCNSLTLPRRGVVESHLPLSAQLAILISWEQSP